MTTAETYIMAGEEECRKRKGEERKGKHNVGDKAHGVQRSIRKKPKRGEERQGKAKRRREDNAQGGGSAFEAEKT